MSFYFLSEKNQRNTNEDSFCQIDIQMNHEACVSVMAVSDGMGGLSEGKMFSERAIRLWYSELMNYILSEAFRDCTLTEQMKALQDFSYVTYQTINKTLYHEGLDQGIRGGTTLSVAIHFRDHWIVSNCGDSPIYAVRDGYVSLISMIHNRAHQMVRDGIIDKNSEEFNRNKNKLMEYLGRREPVHPHIAIVRDEDIDYLLMGSDGAFGDYDEDALEMLFQSGEVPDRDIVSTLFELARMSGENDNQTAILYAAERRFEEEDTRRYDLDRNGWSRYMDQQYSAVDARNCSYKVLEQETTSVTKRLRNRFLGNRR